MKLSHLAMGSLVLVAALSPMGGAHAQTYPPTASNGQVSDTSIRPGECVTFSGDGFAPSSPVEVTDNDAAVGTVNAGATGTFTSEVCPSVLGVHILRGTGTGATGGERVVTAVVNVLGAGLSETGSSTTVPMALVGAGLVGAGAAAVFVASRRRRAAVAL